MIDLSVNRCSPTFFYTLICNYTHKQTFDWSAKHINPFIGLNTGEKFSGWTL